MDVNHSLVTAVREGRLERTKELINCYGLSHSQAWSDGYVLLCLAVENKLSAIARLLLTSGAKVNSKNTEPINTPLHLACLHGDIEIVKMLLDKGANVNVENQIGRTPLHNAIDNMRIEMYDILKQSYYVNAGDNDGTIPRRVAAEEACLQIIEHLLNYGADVNCMCTGTWKKGFTPLHIAVETGSKEVVTLLLNRGANVHVKGDNDITPLHIAAQKGYIHIAEDILNHGACIQSFTLEEGYTPLHLASELGNEEAVKLFLMKGADVNATTNSNLTPLHIATKSGHETVVKLLLHHGATVDDKDKDGKTTLHLAVEKGCLTIVEDVLRNCPDVNNQSNRSSLKMAVLGIGEENNKIVEALLEYGFTINPQDANNAKLLHTAVEKGFVKVVEALLKCNENVNSRVTSNDTTPLHVSAQRGNDDISRMLLNKGANVNATQNDGTTALHIATERGHKEVVKVLLERGAKVESKIKYGCTPLHLGAEKGYQEIVETILKFNANIDSRDEFGRTALHISTENGHREVVKVLLERGAKVDSIRKIGMTPLHLGAKKGYQEIVETLLKCGAEIDSRDKFGRTALHFASEKGHKKVVKVLLERGAKVDSEMEDNFTPLHLGAEEGFQEIIETLLKFGANIDSTDVYGKTALHIASQEGHKDVVVTLLEYGSDINITCRSGCTPLDYALAGILSLDSGVCSCEVTAEALKHQIVKMKTANFYIGDQNLQSMRESGEISGFQDECEEEIARMKNEKINCQNISFYDILAKGISSLALCMRNENIVWALKSGLYKKKFPIYASMIEYHFMKAMERRESLDQGNKNFHFLFKKFPKLPYDCTEKILSYLSNEDLKNVPLNISTPNTNIMH